MAKVLNHPSLCNKTTFFGFCFFLLFGLSTACPWAVADSDVNSSSQQIEKEVLELINAERDKNGVHPLTWDPQLYEAAAAHTEDMASENYFSRTSLDGREIIDRVTDAGYDNSTVSEQIGAGQATAQQIFDEWMTNDDQRDALLDASYCDAGVGHTINEESDWTIYWAIDIGRKKDIEQCAELESEPDPDTQPASEPEEVGDEPGFCEELMQRHTNFCRKHPDLCRAALNKCKRTHE